MQQQQTAEQMMTATIAAIRAQVIAEMQAQQRPKAATQRRLLTCAEAGEYMGKTEAAIRQMVHKKQLPVFRDGRSVRIDVRVLDARIDELTM
jgi:excisionase family DNA binding protein